MKKLFLLFSFSLFIGFASCTDDPEDNETIIIDPVTEEAHGFYIANEDWFGHDDGSVNYIQEDGKVHYRVYREANPGELLGATTQYATVYGDNVYFVSKQGLRFVVADAKTLKKKTAISYIGGDGRFFIGVSPDKGYIATSNGIKIFDIANLSVGASIENISGEVGNMCLVGDHAFAVVKSKGVHIINTRTDKLEKVIEGSYATLTQSKDGNVWIGAGSKLIKMNPYTFETSEQTLTDTSIDGTWFAWNAGRLCASTQRNVLYWTKGKSVVEYNIDEQKLNLALYTIDADEAGKARSFYAAGLRVDPLTDKLILTVVRSGWGDSYSYNWIHIIDSKGNLQKEVVMRGDNGLGADFGNAPTMDDNYYWFPAMPFFKDMNKPEITIGKISLKTAERKAICLSDMVADKDNMTTSIVKNIVYDASNKYVSFEQKQDSLIITSNKETGKTQFKFKANSNGQVVEKEILVDIL